MTDFKIDTADDNVLWYVKGGGATEEERALRKERKADGRGGRAQ